MFNLRTLGVAQKLWLFIGCSLLGVLGVAGVLLASEGRLILEERKSAVRQTVQTAHSLAVYYHGRIGAGGLGEAEARAQAIAAIRALRYGDGEYFWINDMQPAIVMHAVKPGLEGKDASDIKDPTGLALFTEFTRVVRSQGAGFVAYQWPRPGSEQPVDKVSYVAGFAPWGWVIGSGVYVDNVKAAVAVRVYAFGAVTLVITLALLGLGALIRRSLMRQLGGEPALATAATHRMAGGDLACLVEVQRGDQDSLMFALRDMRDGMSAIVGRVRTGSDNILVASQEIACGNLDLSQRTEQTAGNLQQAASSLEQLTANVRQSADAAQQADQLAASASGVARRGGEVFSQVVGTMGDIDKASRQIADIIGVIDGIAFQTNILALNAAVEAARAGEQGRGFAVVAGEVRGLAQRSATAARQIKGLIDTSVDKVATGSRQVADAGATMAEIVSSVQRVSDIIGEISVAAGEQHSGIAQVNQAVTQLEHMTQQNAALVEQSAASAASLRAQAEQLAQAVAVFHVADAAA
jgi:methyl-accepting chemotaxis protein